MPMVLPILTPQAPHKTCMMLTLPAASLFFNCCMSTVCHHMLYDNTNNVAYWIIISNQSKYQNKWVQLLCIYMMNLAVIGVDWDCFCAFTSIYYQYFLPYNYNEIMAVPPPDGGVHLNLQIAWLNDWIYTHNNSVMFSMVTDLALVKCLYLYSPSRLLKE